jgi:hypothetical protein
MHTSPPFLGCQRTQQQQATSSDDDEEQRITIVNLTNKVPIQQAQQSKKQELP